MAQLMVLGTFHMESQQDLHSLANPDRIFEMRQELDEAVAALAVYQPTKVFVEWERTDQSGLETYIDQLVKGERQSTNEIAQLAYPLAKLSGAPLLAIDWMEAGQGLYGFGQVHEVIQENSTLVNLLAPYEPQPADLDKGITWNLRHFNSPEFVKDIQAYYTNLIQVAGDDDYGIGWLIWWYQRNMKIVQNTLSQLEADDRAILLIGSSHKGILENFFADSQQVELVDALTYLT